MTRYLYILFLFLISVGCEDNDIAKDTPDCVKAIIKNLKKQVRNPPAKIFRYTYDSKTVYYIPANCCDAFGDLIDENCNKICSPDGGLGGGGDGKCPVPFQTRTNEKLIWADDRK